MNMRQGKCDYCRTCFRWNAKLMRLRDAYCPQCGEKLQATTYLKNWNWKWMNPTSLGEVIKKFPELFPRLHSEKK